jgi:hypothetical protein
MRNERERDDDKDKELKKCRMKRRAGRKKA